MRGDFFDLGSGDHSMSELGEYAFHSALVRLLNSDSVRRVGDDCGVVPLDDEWSLLVNVDRLSMRVEPSGRARLCVAQMLSDVVCMGGRPEACLVAVGAPRTHSARDLLRLIDEIRKEAHTYGCSLIGGDTKEAPQFSLVGVAVGRALTRELVRRTGGRPGMLIGVTSTGGQQWGLRWARALAIHFGIDLQPDVQEIYEAAEYGLRLPVAESRAVLATGLVRAGVDLSDGLGGGLDALSTGSKCGVRLQVDALHELVAPEVEAVAHPLRVDPTAFALAPGYDWENLYAIEASGAADVLSAVARTGGAFTIIGELTEGPNAILGDRVIPLKELPADRKFDQRYAWEERFGAWRASVSYLFPA